MLLLKEVKLTPVISGLKYNIEEGIYKNILHLCYFYFGEL